ncbi:MAG: hypothetical protein ABJE95_37430 [Byssovorax sp.]
MGTAARRTGLLEQDYLAFERAELEQARHDLDLFVLRKAHAAALLRWRGHPTASP